MFLGGFYSSKEDQGTNLDQAVIGLKAFKELETAANKLWMDLDEIIIKPRTNLPLNGRQGSLYTIQIQQVESPTREKIGGSTDLL